MQPLPPSVRWLWLAFGLQFVLWLGTLGAVRAGWLAPSHLRVRHLAVVDANGKPRIELTTVPTMLVALERKGKTFPTFVAEGATVRLCDADGKERLALRVNADSTCQILVNDRQGRCRIGISVLTQETPSLTLYDADGRGRCLLHLQSDGAPSLCLYDAQWQPLFTAP